MKNVIVPVSLLVSLSVACGVEQPQDSIHDEAEESALFESAYGQTSEGKEDDSGCSGVRVPDQRNFGKRVVLTFDDGPNPATTPKVLETLRRHRAPATFFINGMRVTNDATRALAREIANDPNMILANHSQHHSNLGKATADVVEHEYSATDDIIRATGETPRFFRFPFGSANCSGAQLIRDHHQIITGWHIDSADWCFAAGGGTTCKPSTFKFVPDNMRNDMKGYILSQVRAQGGGILLMHDIHASSANALDGILTTLEAEGYTIARLDDGTVLPKLNGVAATPTKFIGDACTTDTDCKFTVAGQAGRCHAAGFCTASCAGTCPDASGKAPTFCIADGARDAGICVSKAATQNRDCAALSKTTKRVTDRYLGTSTLAPAQVAVCAPKVP